MPEIRRRVKRELVGYEHDCSDCEHAIWRDVLDGDGNPVWEEYEVSGFELVLEKLPSKSYKHKIEWLEDELRPR